VLLNSPATLYATAKSFTVKARVAIRELNPSEEPGYDFITNRVAEAARKRKDFSNGR